MSSITTNNETEPPPPPPPQKKKCIPCESLDKSMLLSTEEVNEFIQTSLTSWSVLNNDNIPSTSSSSPSNGETQESSLQPKIISRKLISKNYQKAMDFLNQVCLIAERENHHPDISLSSYRNVNIELYTHSVGGITKNDLLVAKMIEDELISVNGSTWFKKDGY